MKEHSRGHRFITIILITSVIAVAGCMHGIDGPELHIDKSYLEEVFPNKQGAVPGRIAFGLRGDIYIIAANGVKVVDMDCVYGATWSPDGDDLLVNCKQSGSNPLYDLMVISAPDWSSRELVQKDILMAGGMDWSPDGHKIVFIGMPLDTLYRVHRNGIDITIGLNGIYILNRDGTDRQLVVQCANCCSPVWSPDGSAIAFISSEGVELIEMENSSQRRLLYTFSIDEPAVCYGKNVSWFPDSQRLLISDGLRIQTLNLGDNSVSTLLEIDPLTAEGFLRAIVLPDGEHIVYQAHYKDLACNAGLACYHRELMLARLADMVWRDMTPDIEDKFTLSFLDWWQAP